MAAVGSGFRIGSSATGTLEDTIEKGRDLNDTLADHGLEKLPDAEVVRRATQVHKDFEAGKIERRHGLRGTATTDGDEVQEIDDDAALRMLMMLRIAHGARCARGKTFGIDADAMASANVLPPWSPYKYRNARDYLLEHGYIVVAREGKAGRGTQYRLSDRQLTPSMAVRKAQAKAAAAAARRRGGSE